MDTLTAARGRQVLRTALDRRQTHKDISECVKEARMFMEDTCQRTVVLQSTCEVVSTGSVIRLDEVR